MQANETQRPHLTPVPTALPTGPGITPNDALRLTTPDLSVQGESLHIDFMRERMTSVISATTTMKGGEISSTEGYRIDGVLEGNISAPTIFITENAKVIGKVTGNRVIVLGEVKGEIVANKELIVGHSSSVLGKIHYKEMVTFRGSSIQGQMFKIK